MPRKFRVPDPADRRRGKAPYPPGVYLVSLEFAFAELLASDNPDGPLPGLLPSEITGDCHQCSFLVPCPYHRAKLEAIGDRGGKVR